jgi:hypothetical protein
MKLELTEAEIRTLVQALDVAVRAQGLELAAKVVPIALKLDAAVRADGAP